MITSRFSPEAPISCAQGRHGELIVVQGNGVRPAKWRGFGAAINAGLAAPEAPATITVDTTDNYYVARVDVQRPGACYYSAPAVSFSSEPAVSPVLGRTANASAYLSQSSLSEIRVNNGGKYYPTPPSVELEDSHGKGAILTAILDMPTVSDPSDDPFTGISQWAVIEHPDTTDAETVPRFAATGLKAVDLPITGNGTFTATSTSFVRTRSAPNTVSCPNLPPGYVSTLSYTVTGYTAGSGAVLRLQWDGGEWIATCAGFVNYALYRGATALRSAVRLKYGAGYSDAAAVRVTINSVDGEQAQIVLEGYTAGNASNTTSRRFSVKEIRIDERGSGYLVAPQLKITSDSGFGAYATCTVKDGKIDTVTLESGGGGYKTAPTVEILSGGAEAFAVARPHLRGTYQCYYRYIDDTPEERGGPLPSNLSPVTEVDAGEAATSLTWGLADADIVELLRAESGDTIDFDVFNADFTSVTTTTLIPDTGDASGWAASHIELWRTTSNQATTLYRVATIAITESTFFDDLTDEELRDPDRAGYAAMPIVLPNGELNANRFTPPPSDKAVVVRFQDRYWYGVDTGGEQPNTILFSEVDEPESVPDINEIVLQQNARDADSLTAMIPFGPTLLLMQSRHAYSLTFAKQPVIDAQVSPVAYRGALNQRAWDIYAGLCYVLDQYGVYAISPTGEVQNLSDPIDDLFRHSIDFGKKKWSFLLIDPTTKTLRAFVSFKADESSGFPTRALCYSLDSKAWWIETYPQRVHGGTQVQMSNGDYRCVYGATGGAYLLNEGHVDAARGAVVSVAVTNKGSGYRKPPLVTASGGSGAQFQAVVNGEGEVVSIWILSTGYGYSSGSLFIGPPDDPTYAGVRATATYTATPIEQDTPLFPTYRFKSGCVEYPTDSDDPAAATTQARNIRLLYKPQDSQCDVSLRTYYNNSPHPRRNLVSRQRGIGFSFDPVDSGARLDMAANEARYGADSGVASAMLAGRSLDDVASSDRHVAVELVGARKTAEPVVFYQLDVLGSAGK